MEFERMRGSYIDIESRSHPPTDFIAVFMFPQQRLVTLSHLCVLYNHKLPHMHNK